MALTKGLVTRVPVDGGKAWIEVRRPSVRIMGELQRATLDGSLSGGEQLVFLMERCITAWSYSDEVTAENIGDLDPETAVLLEQQLLKAAESEDERKNASGRTRRH